MEKFTAAYLKRLLRRDIQKGIGRDDTDVNLTAFFINSLYIVSLTSLVSSHFNIRMREYLEIEGEIDAQTIEKQLRRMTVMVDRLLRPVRKE